MKRPFFTAFVFTLTAASAAYGEIFVGEVAGVDAAKGALYLTHRDRDGTVHRDRFFWDARRPDTRVLQNVRVGEKLQLDAFRDTLGWKVRAAAHSPESFFSVADPNASSKLGRADVPSEIIERPPAPAVEPPVAPPAAVASAAPPVAAASVVAPPVVVPAPPPRAVRASIAVPAAKRAEPRPEPRPAVAPAEPRGETRRPRSAWNPLGAVGGAFGAVGRSVGSSINGAGRSIDGAFDSITRRPRRSEL